MKQLISLCICLRASFAAFSQSNIQQSLSVNGTGTAADASAQLDVSAIDKGMLVPRMTSAQRIVIASPATGLLVFDTDTGGFWFYNGMVWTNLAAPKTLLDADGDTKIQVEQSPDEDIIRFDLGGTEKMVLRKNANGAARLELPDACYNTFVGQEAGLDNVSGSSAGYFNSFVGYRSGYSNTIGSYNTFFGSGAGLSNLSGANNTAIGSSALFSKIIGNHNTANGAFALFSNTTGSLNTATGGELSLLLQDAYNLVQEEEITAKLFDQTGRPVRSAKLKARANPLDVSDLTAGFYWLEWSQGGARKVEKIVLVR